MNNALGLFDFCLSTVIAYVQKSIICPLDIQNNLIIILLKNI